MSDHSATVRNGVPAALADSDFLRACRGEPVRRTPVWFMRQAGRSLPEYREARRGVPMLESCFRPDLATEITLQPVRRHGVDAAVFFSDIVVPLKALGIELDIKPGVGPVIEKPVRTRADLDRLVPLDPGMVAPIAEAVRLTVAELGGTPLIGFAGAPFTLASYLVEGGPSRTYENTKAMMYGAPELWRELMERIAGIAAVFLNVQIEAGASAVQLFDSWAGALSPRDYRELVLPASRSVFEAVAATGVPRIHFGVGTGELLRLMSEAGADVVGVDWRVPLDEASRRIGGGKPLQGNLDSTVLFAGDEVVREHARRVLDDAAGLPGHIFNLGHGVMPNTDPEALTRLVAYVHEQTER
ncbi:uroporphyrinogen decarboxylase [Mangrovactinospora gilvigrisea]|uniref:Uroporphyrinogen decarboxylase n=1 Tax=Mangrovactinospora gilvigrisea TaxID=1428644 RepID=A0A1J7C1W8_9ACTN|nr:uroporphyrinogen decarboxylase [Mangrovactinospora gilvigrisea]OIV35568.1 uroporphyrinogen decarboxylase [Mangrovactinospora gilvigrisea]